MRGRPKKMDRKMEKYKTDQIKRKVGEIQTQTEGMKKNVKKEKRDKEK